MNLRLPAPDIQEQLAYLPTNREGTGAAEGDATAAPGRGAGLEAAEIDMGEKAVGEIRWAASDGEPFSFRTEAALHTSGVFATGIAILVAAAPASAVEPVRILPAVAAVEGTFRNSRGLAENSMPRVMRSADEAATLFEGEALASVLRQTDFAVQYALVFAWGGSGYDRMRVAMDAADSSQVVFTRHESMYADYAYNVRIFAVRSDVRWRYAGSTHDAAEGDLLTIEVLPPLPGLGKPDRDLDRVIYRIEEATVDPTVRWTGDSIELRTKEQAAEFFEGEQLDRLVAEADFAQQYVLLLTWSGSPEDEMGASFDASHPREVLFNLKEGETPERRSHLRIYAIRSGVTWRLPKRIDGILAAYRARRGETGTEFDAPAKGAPVATEAKSGELRELEAYRTFRGTVSSGEFLVP